MGAALAFGGLGGRRGGVRGNVLRLASFGSRGRNSPHSLFLRRGKRHLAAFSGRRNSPLPFRLKPALPRFGTVLRGKRSTRFILRTSNAGGFPPHPPSVRTGHLPLKGKANKVRTNSESYLAQWAPPLRLGDLAVDAAAWEPAAEETRFFPFPRFA